MVQDNNNKVKSLSPAVSAFQFQVKSGGSSLGPGQGDGTIKITTTEDYFNNSKNYQSSPSTPTIPIKEGYIYKDQLIILDEETRLKLTQMGQLPLDAEWTFWYDKYVCVCVYACIWFFNVVIDLYPIYQHLTMNQI